MIQDVEDIDDLPIGHESDRGVIKFLAHLSPAKDPDMIMVLDVKPVLSAFGFDRGQQSGEFTIRLGENSFESLLSMLGNEAGFYDLDIEEVRVDEGTKAYFLERCKSDHIVVITDNGDIYLSIAFTFKREINTTLTIH